MPAAQVTPVQGITRESFCRPSSTEVPLSRAESETLASGLSALSDPLRLQLLSTVAAQGEVCSCSLSAALGRSQPMISHHCRVLAQAGLLQGERRGRWVWWRVVPERLASLGQVFEG